MAGATTEAAVDWFLHPVLAGLGDNTEAEIAAARVSHGPAEEAGQPVDGGRILGDQGFRGERGAGTFRA